MASVVIVVDLEIVAAAEVATTMIAEDSGTTGEIIAIAMKNQVTTEIVMTTAVAHLNSIVRTHTDHMRTDEAAMTSIVTTIEGLHVMITETSIAVTVVMTEGRHVIVMSGATDPTRGGSTLTVVKTGDPHLAETTMIAVTVAALEALRETETSTVIHATKFGPDLRTREMSHHNHGRLLATPET